MILCRYQKTTFRNQFSPLTAQVSGLKLRSSDQVSRYLYQPILLLRQSVTGWMELTLQVD